MKSQLQMLQERVEAVKKARAVQAQSEDHHAQTICVTSGKGGVGKTVFSVNFAISLAEQGQKVVVIDADFGFSNVNVMLGRNAPYTLQHVISGEKRLDEVMEESYPNVWYISGGSGVSELIDLQGLQLETMLSQLAELERKMDFIILDTGAGINANILRMIESADRTIIVTTPEPTSVLDSYVVLKTAAELPGPPPVEVLINRAQSDKEASSTFASLSSVARQNLNYDVTMLGYVPADSRISKSIKAMVPFMIQYPMSGPTIQLRRIAEGIVQPAAEQTSAKRRGVRGFFQRLIGR